MSNKNNGKGAQGATIQQEEKRIVKIADLVIDQEQVKEQARKEAAFIAAEAEAKARDEARKIENERAGLILAQSEKATKLQKLLDHRFKFQDHLQELQKMSSNNDDQIIKIKLVDAFSHEYTIRGASYLDDVVELLRVKISENLEKVEDEILSI